MDLEGAAAQHHKGLHDPDDNDPEGYPAPDCPLCHPELEDR